MTSNLGSHLIQEKFAEVGGRPDESWNHALVMELIKASVHPDDRIDEIVLFELLNPKNLRKIVGIQFKGIQRRLAEQGITLEAADEVLEKLAEEGYESRATPAQLRCSPAQTRVTTPASQSTLEGDHGRNRG